MTGLQTERLMSPAPLEDLATGTVKDLTTALKVSFGAPTAFAPSEEKAPPKPSAKGASKPGRSRTLKTLAGALLVCAFGVVPVYNLLLPSSAEAVLNARVVTLRAPISGRIDTLQPVDDARIVAKGTELLTIHNSRTDRNRSEDLRSQQGRFTNERNAIDAKLRHAQAEYGQLAAVVDRFREGRIVQLEARKAELANNIAKAGLQQDEAASALQRSRSLAGSGNLSDVELARIARVASIASLDEQTLQHRLVATEQELEAARSGVFIGDSSNNDRSSSFQRAEAVRNEIAALEVERDRTGAEIERVTSEISVEAARLELLSTAAIGVPADGRVWERLVSPGEEVQVGQDLVRMVDCSTSVVTANVSEGVYNTLMVGTAGRFIPADGGPEITGKVVNLTGFANAAANLAIEPTSLRKEPYRVTVSLDGPKTASECLIGRTGRVMFGQEPAFLP